MAETTRVLGRQRGWLATVVSPVVVGVLIASVVVAVGDPRLPILGLAALVVMSALWLRPDWLVGGLVCAAALYAYRVTVPLGFNVSLYRILFLLLGARLAWDVAIVGILRPRPIAEFWRRSNVLVGLLGLVVVGYAIGMARGPDGMAGLLGTKRFFNVVVGLFTVLLIAFYLCDVRRFRMAAGMYMLGASLVVLIGAYQYSTWLLTGSFPPLPFQKFIWLEELSVKTDVVTALAFPRLESVFHDPNVLGAYLVLAILIGVGLHRDARKAPTSTKLALSAATLLSGLALGATLSRSAFAMLGLAMSIYAWPWRHEIMHRRRQLAWLFGVAAVIVSAAALWLFVTRPEIGELARTVWDVRLRPTWDPTRKERFTLAVELFAESPILGAGLGAIYARIPVDLTSTAHNFYLTLLAEVGLAGFGAAMSLVLFLTIQAIRDLRLSSTPGSGAPRALAAGFIGLLAVQVVYDSLFSPEVFWVFMGLVAARRVMAADPQWGSRSTE